MTCRTALPLFAALGVGLGLACSSGSSPAISFDGGHTPSGDSGHSGSGTGGDSGSGDDAGGDDSGSGDAGQGDANEGDANFSVSYECTVPDASPSSGSCITVVPANDAGTGIQCNPVTNAGCSAGEACDINTGQNSTTVIGFLCYPGPNTEDICAECNDGINDAGECAAGGTCLLSNASTAQCARYCCTDADCGNGRCVTSIQGPALFGPVAPTLGVCVSPPVDGGAPPADAGSHDGGTLDGGSSDSGSHDAGAPADASHG
jgi:hypothetical protein